MWPRTWEALGRKAPPVSFAGSSAWTVDCQPQDSETKTAVSEALSVSCAAAAPGHSAERGLRRPSLHSATHRHSWDVKQPGRGPLLSITGPASRCLAAGLSSAESQLCPLLHPQTRHPWLGWGGGVTSAVGLSGVLSPVSPPWAGYLGSGACSLALPKGVGGKDWTVPTASLSTVSSIF